MELARTQLARDRKRTARVDAWMKGKWLFRHKIDRMSPSPLAFLRGAAPLFYEILERVPILAKGPSGEGVIVGDLHLENFGAFRPNPKKGLHKNAEADAVFDANDFDDAAIGPWRFDLLRLTTSLILGGRELGANGREALALSASLLDAYAREIRSPRTLPKEPPAVRALVARASHRDRAALLDARTEPWKKKSRRFVRGERYATLSRELARDAEEAFAKYVESHFPKRHHPLYEVRDMAFRIAGTGSLGCLRIALLVRGKARGEWIFDMKEEDAQPSCADLIGKQKVRGAERVESAMRSSLERVPRALGRTKLRGMSMLVRRLTPQEDKIDLTNFPKTELDALARLMGALIGRAHVRGATKPAHAWSESDQRHIIDSACRLAGMHEAAYLCWCQLAR